MTMKPPTCGTVEWGPFLHFMMKNDLTKKRQIKVGKKGHFFNQFKELKKWISWQMKG